MKLVMKFFLTIINEERNYRELKERIRMIKSQKDQKIDTDINSKVSKSTNSKTRMLSKCAIYGSKISKFIKEQQAKGLLSNLGIRTHLNKIPLLGDILF